MYDKIWKCWASKLTDWDRFIWSSVNRLNKWIIRSAYILHHSVTCFLSPFSGSHSAYLEYHFFYEPLTPARSGVNLVRKIGGICRMRQMHLGSWWFFMSSVSLEICILYELVMSCDHIDSYVSKQYEKKINVSYFYQNFSIFSEHLLFSFLKNLTTAPPIGFKIF